MTISATRVVRDAEATRNRILAAAVALFAERGFGQVGVRELAARADANPALVFRYFGSKEALFRAALEATTTMEPILAMDRRRMGAGVAALFAGVGDAPNPLAMIVLSASDPEARAISIEVLESRVIAPLAAHLGPPDAEARAARLNILWAGFLTARNLLPTAPLADDRLPSILHWLATSTQAIVDEDAGA